MSTMRGSAGDVESFVTTDDVAEFLSVKKTWIYNNHEQLKMPARKIGGQLRWKLSEVDAWATGNGDLLAAPKPGKLRSRH